MGVVALLAGTWPPFVPGFDPGSGLLAAARGDSDHLGSSYSVALLPLGPVVPDSLRLVSPSDFDV